MASFILWEKKKEFYYSIHIEKKRIIVKLSNKPRMSDTHINIAPSQYTRGVYSRIDFRCDDVTIFLWSRSRLIIIAIGSHFSTCLIQIVYSLDSWIGGWYTFPYMYRYRCASVVANFPHHICFVGSFHNVCILTVSTWHSSEEIWHAW